MDEKDQAAAYLKLQDDVKQLIVDTMFKEFQNYGSPLYNQLKSNLLYSQEFRDAVKNVVKDQMMKY